MIMLRSQEVKLSDKIQHVIDKSLQAEDETLALLKDHSLILEFKIEELN